MGEAQLQRTVAEATVFGRLTPQQKEMLIRRFRAEGHCVAMVGDGVNDVRPLHR